MSQPEPPFVVDLHAHFPMHFDPESQSFRRHIKRAVHREKLADKVKFGILELADKFFNREHPKDGHAVTIDTLRAGNVGVALSVAYCPFAELDLEEPYGAPPRDSYFKTLHDLLLVVEDNVKKDGRAEIVRNFAELEAARVAGKVALIHAVEGGFHIGKSHDAIARHVGELAKLGAGYVTVAHLFYRQVATNVPALPFLPDSIYEALFHQDAAVGLDERGRTLVTELVRHGILVDLTHMSEAGMRQTFDVLDRIDPDRKVPLFASHIACSFGKYEYNMKREWVEKIAERRGVCGIIYCDHYMRDGRGQETKTLEESFDVIETQIERLRAWGGDDVLAIGSDLDGFIKPTLGGLSSAANHRDLAALLERAYGRPLAEKICHKNALRVFEQAWMRPVAIP